MNVPYGGSPIPAGLDLTPFLQFIPGGPTLAKAGGLSINVSDPVLDGFYGVLNGQADLLSALGFPSQRVLRTVASCIGK